MVADEVPARRLTFFSPEPALDGDIDYLEQLELLPDGCSTCGMGEPRFGGLMEPRTLVLWGPTCIQGQGDVGLRASRHGIHVWEPDAEKATVPDTVEREWRLERPGEPLPDRFAPVPLSAGVDVAVTRRRICFTSPEHYTVTALSKTGRPVMIVRYLAPRRRVDDDLRSQFEQVRSPDRLEELATSHYPDSLPTFDRVVAGEGEIWVRHFPEPADTTNHWSVYGDDGAAKGIVTLPTNFELTTVRGGRAYSVTTHAMDVERIHVFEAPVR